MHAGSTDARLDALGAKIDDLASSIDKRFEQVERRLEGLESRFFYLQLTLTGGLLGVVATLLAAPHL
jgi:hypothetical protein